MITVEQACALKHGDIIHHATQRNADGTPVRARVTGKVQVWKTRPGDYRVPLKSGMYAYGALSPSVAHAWFLTAEEALA